MFRSYEDNEINKTLEHLQKIAKELDDRELKIWLKDEQLKLEIMARNEFRSTGMLSSFKLAEQSQKVDIIMNEVEHRSGGESSAETSADSIIRAGLSETDFKGYDPK